MSYSNQFPTYHKVELTYKDVYSIVELQKYSIPYNSEYNKYNEGWYKMTHQELIEHIGNKIHIKKFSTIVNYEIRSAVRAKQLEINHNKREEEKKLKEEEKKKDFPIHQKLMTPCFKDISNCVNVKGFCSITMRRINSRILRRRCHQNFELRLINKDTEENYYGSKDKVLNKADITSEHMKNHLIENNIDSDEIGKSWSKKFLATIIFCLEEVPYGWNHTNRKFIDEFSREQMLLCKKKKIGW